MKSFGLAGAPVGPVAPGAPGVRLAKSARGRAQDGSGFRLFVSTVDGKCGCPPLSPRAYWSRKPSPNAARFRFEPNSVSCRGASLQRFTVMRVQKGRNGTLPCSAVITCPLLARLQGEKCLPFPYFNFHYRTDAFSDLDHMTFETRSGLQLPYRFCR